MYVLIVDDEDLIRWTLEASLEAMGHQVDTCSTAEQNAHLPQ